MKQVISLTQSKFNLDEIKKLIPKDYLIVFFSPIEWIDEIGKSISENYENSIGCSSYKNINKNIFDYYSVSFLGIKIENVQLLLLKDIKNNIISYYKEILSLKDIYKKNHSVLLEFTDGLSLAEESVLTVLTNELPDIPLIGGSSADNGDFLSTKVCINGESASNASALCMITTPMEIEYYCENIYEPTEIKGIISRSELFERKVHEINGIPAVDFYCNSLNISKEHMKDEFIYHPFARIVGNRYFISSIMNNDQNSFNLYGRIFQESYISICNPMDYIKLWEDASKKYADSYLGGIFINCIFRTHLFEKENSIKNFQKYLSTFGEFICMTSYGEQYCDSHANQTMSYCLFK